jgi:phage repressor protein C with HTH and peptisase S24 domain
MEPRYYSGELAHVHPGKPVTIGAFVLVQIRPDQEDDTPKAVVKRLIRRSATKIVLEQYNPPKKFEIKADDIVSIHRVVGSGEF